MISADIDGVEPPRQMVPSTISAIIRALRDSEVDLAFAVSGAPATRLAQALVPEIPRFEWSLNEKVAAEAAVGVSAASRRSALVFKVCGLHVALDPLANAASHGIGAGIVVFSGDDTAATSSTVLQDSRMLAQVAGLPVLELSARCDAVAVVCHAYQLSEEGGIPVVVRFREDLYDDVHAPMEAPAPPRRATRNRQAVDTAVAHRLTKLGRQQHHRLVTWRAVQDYLDAAGLVRQTHQGRCDLGAIVVGGAGLAGTQVTSASVCVLECDVSWPLLASVTEFAARHDTVLVLEAPRPFVERELRVATRGRVVGRLTGHLAPEGPADALDVLVRGGSLRGPATWDSISHKADPPPTDLPYARLFEAVTRLAADGWFVSADVGSCVKLCYPPYEAATVALCLGSPIAVSAGYTRACGAVALSVIGDYALLHSGLEGVLEMAHRGIGGVIVVMANGIAAQTGNQPTAAAGSHRPVLLRRLLRASGVQVIESWHVEAEPVHTHVERLTEMLLSGRLCAALVTQGRGIADGDTD